MGLLLRYDTKGQALRSVGDPPHGVLAIAAPDDKATFVIDPGLEMDPTPTNRIDVELTPISIDGGMLPTSTPISVGRALDACASALEMRMIASAVARSMVSAAQVNASLPAPFAIDYLRGHVDFLVELQAALEERGMLSDAQP